MWSFVWDMYKCWVEKWPKGILQENMTEVIIHFNEM
jgi:hypothetical protein